MSVPTHRSERILIIDDDPGMCTLVQELVGTKFTITACASLADGLQKAICTRCELIILDHRLPDGHGLDVISELLAADRLRPILYITAQSASQTAIEAIRLGAFDYLTKPVDFGHLRERILQASEYRQLTRTPVMVDTAGESVAQPNVLVGHCQAMQNVYKTIGRLARMNVPVLIEGEVGTGKELAARTIHSHSPHASRPFTKVSSQALSASLTAHEHAHRFRPQLLSQLFLEVEGGTIFVEELAELSAEDQYRLLTTLRDSAKDLTTRTIFATAFDSHHLLETGKLRSDLYYLLSPYQLTMPPLRQRGADLDLLVSHFMHALTRVTAASPNQGPPRVSSGALALLHRHQWPGNVAQLKSILESVLLESGGAILATESLMRALNQHQQPDTPVAQSALHRAEPDSSANWHVAKFIRERIEQGSESLYDESVQALEHMLVAQVLLHTDGNQARAAKILGITRTSLRRKISALGIDVGTLTSNRQNIP